MKRNIEYKKSILLSIGFLFFNGCILAQELDRINQLLAAKELARAREAVDSAASIYPTTAVWLLKAAVYDAISKDPVAKTMLADARWEAFLSLQKAVLADTSVNDLQTAAGKSKLATDLYNGFTLEAMTYFNAGAEREDKAGFVTALSLFKKAAAVSQFMYRGNLGKPEVDTLNLLYLSKSAVYADKEDDAIIYCKKIADKKIIDPANKPGYEIVYQWLVYYYKSRKEAEPFAKYLAAARLQFPQSAYFSLAEIDWLRDQQQFKELFKKYRELLQKFPANAGYKLAYYRDQFNYIWRPGSTSQQHTLVSVKALISGLQQLITGNKQNLVAMNARLLLARLYSNQAQDVTRELMMRSTTDPMVTGSYKKRYKDLLLLSNKYLKQITAGKTQNQTIGREAAQLLKQNTIALKQQ